ncbi:MAG: helix-turn-helix transcriptional regulator [Victivallaceae bacterium]|nr:helix-turn-helix transcriptional regulator [Victivallaceae bacterium]
MYIPPMNTLNTSTKYDYHLTSGKPFWVYHEFSPPNNSMPLPDIHYSLHLGVLLKGCFESVYSDYREIKKPGDVWFCGSWEPHAAHRMGFETEMMLITILPGKIGEVGFSSEVNWMLPFIIPVPDRPHVTDDTMRSKVIYLGREISKIADQKDPGWDILCWLKLHELLLLLICSSSFDSRPELKEQNAAFTRIQPAIKLVKEMNGMPISLEEAANACYLGKSRFCVLFQTAMGTTFAKYAARTRISMAASDIIIKKSLIKEVAAAWGFFDESHFYRVFQQYFHCSPSEYRSISPEPQKVVKDD